MTTKRIISLELSFSWIWTRTFSYCLEEVLGVGGEGQTIMSPWFETDLFFKSHGQTGKTQTRKVGLAGGKLIVSLTQGMVISSTKSSQWPVSSGVSEGLTLGPILLNIFMNNLNSGTEYALTKLVGGAKLVVNVLRARLLFWGTSRGWRNGLTATSWSSVMTSVKSCTLCRITLCKYMEWGPTGKEAALPRKT